MEICKPTSLRDAQRLVQNPDISADLYVVVVHVAIYGGVEFATALLEWLTTPGFKLGEVIIFTPHGIYRGSPERLTVVSTIDEVKKLVHKVMQEVIDHEEPYWHNT